MFKFISWINISSDRNPAAAIVNFCYGSSLPNGEFVNVNCPRDEKSR